MSEFYRNLIEKKFNELAKRERIVVFIGFVICISSIAYFWFVDAALDQQKQTLQSSQKIIKEQKTISSQIRNVKLRLKQDPEKDMQNKIDALENKLKFILQNQQVKYTKVIPAKFEKLKNALDKESKIKIKLVKAHPIVKLKEIVSKTAHGHDVLFYKHSFEIEFSGRFEDVYEYVLKLENLTSKYYWESFNYKVEKYPNANVAIRIYTLSERLGLNHD